MAKIKLSNPKIPQFYTVRTNTASYTLSDIDCEIIECLSILKSLGISDADNVRAIAGWGHKLRAYGTCHFNHKAYNSDIRYYNIDINKEYIKVADPDDVHNTIMHEVLHCLKGCMDHGTTWKSYAALVNKNYPSYTKIQRLGNSQEYKQEVLMNKYKYSITCEGCKKTWYYLRYSKTMDSCKAKRARCRLCGSNSFEIKTLR